MFLEGNTEVFARLFEKQALRAAGDARHEAIRPLLIILSGTMRGVYGGGQVCALELFGLSDAFDTAIGVSTGTPTVAYFLAWQSALGTSIYCNECATRRFLSLLPWPKIDVDYIAAILRGNESHKRLDETAIRASRTRFLAGVTCAKSGDAILLDAKEAKPDIVQAVRASIAIPSITSGAVCVNGMECLDGVGAHPFPATLAIERFAPTDILVLANGPPDEEEGVAKLALWRVLTARMPQPVRDVFATRAIRYARELQFLREQRACRVAIIWSDREVGVLERNRHKLSAARHRAEQHLVQILADAKKACP